MGNFSRDTYRPAQNYAAVRLQQGVPLVDADWNEQADIARNELYRALDVSTGTVVARGTLQLTGVGNNDLTLSTGQAVISGRPLNLAAKRQYTTQRYRDAALATKDGVPRPPDLTTPAQARTDIVYLDVFEREVNSAEDPVLINAAIGIETSVRTVREIVLRVAENTATLPAAPPGHQLLPLALLRRTAGAPVISPAMIEDIKPYPDVRGTRRLALPPTFVPLNFAPLGSGAGSPYAPWAIVGGYAGSRTRAVKPPSKDAWGLIPLLLPDGASLRRLRMRGTRAGELAFSLDRQSHDPTAAAEKVADGSLAELAQSAPFDHEVAIAPDGRHIVDNSLYCYTVQAWAKTVAKDTEIHGIVVTYDP